jgi:DNA-binding NarL/FixJ family response regulator
MARELASHDLMEKVRFTRSRQAADSFAAHEEPRDIRVCIIESHAIVRAGLRMLLEQEDRIEVVCEASSGNEALSFAASQRPSVVIIDIDADENNDLDLVSTIAQELAPVRVLVLTALEDPEVHLRAMEKGAIGLVMLKQAPEILVRAVRAVSGGESWIGQAISAAAIKKLTRMQSSSERTDPEAEKIALLTAREREVVGIVKQGYNGARIAAELRISEATVRHHITSILAKLGLSNKLELAVYAFHNDLGPRAGHS